MYSKEAVLLKAVIIASVVIGIIIISFIISVIRQQRKFHLFQKYKIDAEITTLENERKRIAEDIHDDLGPILSAIKFKLDCIEDLQKEAKAQITNCIRYTDDVITKIRSIANDLKPNTAMPNGALYALQEFIDTTVTDSGLQVSFTASHLSDLSHTRQLHVYRILQEIIHNTLKHARATVLKIELHQKKKKLIILTSDNGIGFNYNEGAMDFTGLGLRNLQSRTDLLEGKMYINAKPGNGTQFRIELPINL